MADGTTIIIISVVSILRILNRQGIVTSLFYLERKRLRLLTTHTHQLRITQSNRKPIVIFTADRIIKGYNCPLTAIKLPAHLAHRITLMIVGSPAIYSMQLIKTNGIALGYSSSTTSNIRSCHRSDFRR